MIIAEITQERRIVLTKTPRKYFRLFFFHCQAARVKWTVLFANIHLLRMSQAAVTYPLAAISTWLYPEGRKLPGAALFIIPSTLRVILFTNYLKLKLGNLTRLFDTRPQTLKQTKELDSLFPQYSTEIHYCNHGRKGKMRNCTDLWICGAWGFFVAVATLRGPNRSEKEEAGMQFSSWDQGSQSNIAKIIRTEQQEAFKCSVWQEKETCSL